MDSGSAVLVKETSRSPSERETSFCSRRRAVSLAPIGYPDASPIAMTKAPAPGTRKRGRMKGSSRTPIKWTTPKPIGISEAIKKGSRAGKTTSHQIFSPFKAESKACSGYRSNERTKKAATVPNRIVFKWLLCTEVLVCTFVPPVLAVFDNMSTRRSAQIDRSSIRRAADVCLSKGGESLVSAKSGAGLGFGCRTRLGSHRGVESVGAGGNPDRHDRRKQHGQPDRDGLRQRRRSGDDGTVGDPSKAEPVARL